MDAKKFFLAGDNESTAVQADISETTDIDALKASLAGAHAIVEPSGKYSNHYIWHQRTTF